MKPSQVLIGITALGAQLALAATPAGSSPQVDKDVVLAFGKNFVSPPGEMINQTVADAAQPAVYYNTYDDHKTRKPDTYILTMVDLSLPFFALPPTTDFASLVPGVGPNRTTRLHWFEYDVTASGRFGALVNRSLPIAEYEGPQPPAGDIPHDYVVYLFKQPAGYKAPVDKRAYYADETSFARMNFSVQALVDEVGVPVAANYFRVQHEGDATA